MKSGGTAQQWSMQFKHLLRVAWALLLLFLSTVEQTEAEMRERNDLYDRSSFIVRAYAREMMKQHLYVVMFIIIRSFSYSTSLIHQL